MTTPITPYEQQALAELRQWQQRVQAPPDRLDRLSAGMQRRMNNLIPDRVHAVVTTAIKQMTRAVLFGAEFIRTPPLTDASLWTRETAVLERLTVYKNTGAVEGGVTGAGGLLLGLADFPLLLSLKMKLLYDVAPLYGYDTADYRERLFLLHVFQLAFSSPQRRLTTYAQVADWAAYSAQLPTDIHQFDWRTFQQEYRDYIDLAKLAQLVPGIGAVVGVVANYRLIDRLGTTAMNAYRLRWFAERSGRQRSEPATT